MTMRFVIFLLVILDVNVESLQNLVPTWKGFPRASQQRGGPAIEEDLVQAIASGAAAESDIMSLVSQLESLPSISQPAIAPEIYGRWKLLYTTSPNTSSPIQRTATSSSSKFPIYQDILVEDEQLVVNQVIEFSDSNLLTVNALASTAAYPLPELTERRSTGKVLGLNVLGVSLVGEEAQPREDRPDSRIDFVFDAGYFALGTTTIPYPVPFRLPILRDWVKGWIDVTYLSSTLRISRGNKGSLFVLVKANE